ncbi:MAG: hypothetical protein ABIV06_12865 [Thermoanaerobaculia bacterium]
MIRPLRTFHRWIWILLALLLPVLLLAAWRARQPLSPTPLQDLPAALAPDAQPADDSARPAL